ncbi:hypothetical protein [Nostoc sp.]|uniref:hypothetical protein n=1 Tax=Nostoc sp. TaxID=1180 RepID=UPI002FF6BD70
MSRFSNFTYYIRCNNLDLIEQIFTRILEQEGSRRIPLPILPKNDIEKLRDQPWILCNELWIIGLFVGSLGWTIVKIVPEELLCHRAKDADRPRLSELAMHINSDTFYIGCNGGSILMEVDAWFS